MYVHLGGDMVVPVTEVVAILDARLLEGSDINQELVSRAVKVKRLLGPGVGPDCKALVVTRDSVYTSRISAPTLAGRMAHFREAAISWEAESQG